MIAIAAWWSAVIDEPHRRLTVCALTSFGIGGQELREAGHVEGLLERLLHAAPDDVVDLGGVDLGVAAQERR